MVVEVPDVVGALENAVRVKHSEIYNLLHPLSPEALAFAYALAPKASVKKRIQYYLSSLRGVKLSVGGQVLRKMGIPPSPVYNIVLKELLAAKLDGKVETPEQEMQFVAERIREGRPLQ
jgi:tRNA nucleotidyltransferase (CCA-adding enzyme)